MSANIVALAKGKPANRIYLKSATKKLIEHSRIWNCCSLIAGSRYKAPRGGGVNRILAVWIRAVPGMLNLQK